MRITLKTREGGFCTANGPIKEVRGIVKDIKISERTHRQRKFTSATILIGPHTLNMGGAYGGRLKLEVGKHAHLITRPYVAKNHQTYHFPATPLMLYVK